MRVLFVDSGGPGFHCRYAYDIHSTIVRDFHYPIRQISPWQLNLSLIKQFKPDVLLVVHGTNTGVRWIRLARTMGITTVLWVVEDPYEIDLHRGETVNAYDLVFTNEKQAVREYTRGRVFYLPWCCNPLIHKSLTVSEVYRSDLCIVGMGFGNRVQLLNAIAPAVKSLNIKLIGDWGSWGAELHPDLKRFVAPVLDDFREVQKYYNGAKINLNIHRNPFEPPSFNRMSVSATSPNDRAFALAGCGSFQIVDQTRPDLWDCFRPGRDMVGFSDETDLIRLINYFLDKPEKRREIGKSSQTNAYTRHTFAHRLAEVFKTVHLLQRNQANYKEQGIKTIRQPGESVWRGMV